MEANPELLLEDFDLERPLGPGIKNSPSAMAIDVMDNSVVNEELVQGSISNDKTINCMLIGAPSVGKHDLINSLFPEEGGSDSGPLM